MNILLLCNYDPYNAAMVCDHINAFHQYSKHEVVILSYMVTQGGDLPHDIDLDLFDGIILHYSLFLTIDAYVSERSRHKLRVFKGLKVIFLQDEYRCVDETITHIRALGFHLIFTCIPSSLMENIYPPSKLPGVRCINVLTGYVAENLIHYVPRPLNKRPYHVSYRGRLYPSWHGRLGREKRIIGENFLKDAKKYHLKVNISCLEKDRLYGAQWINLIQDSCAVLGVESGSSVIDFTGKISKTLETLHALLNPNSQKDLPDICEEGYYKQFEDLYPMEQISPRIFEAIALRSLCILYEGHYSGVLEPWRHYVPLKKDHSNMEEVVAILNDHERLAQIITTAYLEIAINPKYSYKTFVQMVDQVLDDTYLTLQKNHPKQEYKHFTEDSGITIKAISQKYPFYFIKNPHGLNRRKGIWGRSLTSISKILPRVVTRYLPLTFIQYLKRHIS